MAFGIGTAIAVGQAIATLQEARVRQAEAATQAQRGMIGDQWSEAQQMEMALQARLRSGTPYMEYNPLSPGDTVTIADVFKPKTASFKAESVVTSEPRVINWYGLSRKDEIRRKFKNLVKMISKRANRPSDLPNVNALAVLPEPIAKVPVPRTDLQDQWTMEQIMTYTR